jgi:hypothetical protein
VVECSSSSGNSHRNPWLTSPLNESSTGRTLLVQQAGWTVAPDRTTRARGHPRHRGSAAPIGGVPFALACVPDRRAHCPPPNVAQRPRWRQLDVSSRPFMGRFPAGHPEHRTRFPHSSCGASLGPAPLGRLSFRGPGPVCQSQAGDGLTSPLHAGRSYDAPRLPAYRSFSAVVISLAFDPGSSCHIMRPVSSA